MTDTIRIDAIIPDSKVGALLEEFPQLEDVLIQMSPAFGHLRNPVLRKTVAKVATLRQIARIGDVPLRKLINTLRQAVGFKEEWSEDAVAGATDGAPNWMQNATVTKSLDARPIISGGGHPLEQVLRELRELPAGSIYLLITPFLPAPLLDLLKKQGYQVWSRKNDEGLHENYVRKGDGV
ncbi:MAG: DUF1858 domain-containing protein [Candidatus Zixiibacteriota bacterium]|nr:MAG: DUF1858 domain-containing protein [candidate division Zixibacteria bacterium]